jgi:hypothetical protein
LAEATAKTHVGLSRKFYDLKEAHKSPIATEAVERIAPLYGIEEEIRGKSPGEDSGTRLIGSIASSRTILAKNAVAQRPVKSKRSRPELCNMAKHFSITLGIQMASW